MTDEEIVALYFDRSENAISETKLKYGKSCRYIAYNILGDERDAEEIENDTYLKVWASIPPEHPRSLSAYVLAISRRTALDRLRSHRRQKRGDGEYTLALDELKECCPFPENEKADEKFALRDSLNRFLAVLPCEARKIFMQRYWYMRQIADIAKDFSMSESKVKMTLLRTRKKLKEHLEKEGFGI